MLFIVRTYNIIVLLCIYIGVLQTSREPWPWGCSHWCTERLEQCLVRSCLASSLTLPACSGSTAAAGEATAGSTTTQHSATEHLRLASRESFSTSYFLSSPGLCTQRMERRTFLVLSRRVALLAPARVPLKAPRGQQGGF